jgi:uncharacterized tellurite resistance protein B-like protein
MLDRIRAFFDTRIAAAQDETGGRHSIELATAALLVEVLRIDNQVTPIERDAVLRAVREKFGLSVPDAHDLIELAEEEVRQATDYFQFTSLINQRFSAEQKARVVELMWRVAYADRELSAHELHLMRKIADLLHVPHADYIAAKMRARDRAD